MFGFLFRIGLAAVAGWAIWRSIQELEPATDDQVSANRNDPTLNPPSPRSIETVKIEVASPPATVTDVTPPAVEAVASPPAAAPVADGKTIEAYCVRCKQRRTVINAHEETTSNGRRGARGICETCGANVFVMLRRDAS